MASDRRQMASRGRALRFPLLASAAAALILLAFAVPASADVVYDDAPAAGVERPSFGFAETGTAELGTLVRFAGVARSDPRISIPVASSAEAPITAPITVSVYAPAADAAVGQLLARRTESFEIDSEPGFRSIELGLPGLTLPDEAIVSVAFEDESLALALAGPPATGANPREAEGAYRAAVSEGAVGALEFEPFSAPGQTLQPALVVEAFTATTVAAAAPATTVPAPPPAPRTFHREYGVPASKRMTVSFPRPIARIAGPGALVQVRCKGSSAARCIGTLSLEAAGTVHKAPFSISKGRKQYVVVPLGDDLEHLDALRAPRATATASTIQLGGAAVKTKRALRLK